MLTLDSPPARASRRSFLESRFSTSFSVRKVTLVEEVLRGVCDALLVLGGFERHGLEALVDDFCRSDLLAGFERLHKVPNKDRFQAVREYCEVDRTAAELLLQALAHKEEKRDFLLFFGLARAGNGIRGCAYKLRLTCTLLCSIVMEFIF